MTGNTNIIEPNSKNEHKLRILAGTFYDRCCLTERYLTPQPAIRLVFGIVGRPLTPSRDLFHKAPK